MANPNPKTEYLALGRGKRPTLNHETMTMRLAPEIRAELEEIAQQYNCTYGGKPWIAGLLTKIGKGELIIVPGAPYLEKPRSKHKEQFAELVKNKHKRKRRESE